MGHGCLTGGTCQRHSRANVAPSECLLSTLLLRGVYHEPWLLNERTLAVVETGHPHCTGSGHGTLMLATGHNDDLPACR